MMTSLDDTVKYLILSYFSIFPTRMHALTHLFLCNGNGYQWALDDNSEAYLQGIRLEEMPESIALKEERDIDRMLASMGKTSSLPMENMIRAWVSENIEEYSKASFRFCSTDLRPSLPNSVSYQYNLIINAPDNIREDWKQAILEVAEYYMEKLNPTGCVYGSKEALDIVRRTQPQHAKLFLLLFNAKKRFSNKDKVMKSVFSKINKGKSKEQVLMEKFESSGLSDQITFDEFKCVRDESLANGRISSLDLKDLIEGYISSRDRYFNNRSQIANQQLYKDVDAVLADCTSHKYLQVNCIAGQICRRLDIDAFFEKKIQHIVYDRFYECVAVA